MKKALLLIALFTFVAGFAQINYEPGYFIDNSGKKTTCLIKNIGWKNAPVDFDYRTEEGSETNRGTIANISEFGVNNTYKFKRYTVNIDRSGSSSTDRMSENPQPQWSKETLFLKVLVEGKATLYQYEDSNLVKYFYSSNNHATAEQLLYREYKSGGVIKENNMFRQHLYNLMKDDNTKLSKFESLKYKREPLVALFTEYNGNTGEATANLSEKHNKGSVNLKITPGVGLRFLSLDNSINGGIGTGSFELKTAVTYRLGLELEYVMPFNNNKWAIFIDPNIQFYKNTDSQTSQFYTRTFDNDFDVKYTYLEVPVGARHYMFLNNNSKLFVDVAYVIALQTGSSNIKHNTADALEISKASNLALGAGYSHGRYSAAVRYSFGRGLLDKYGTWDSSYTSVGLIVGYKLF